MSNLLTWSWGLLSRALTPQAAPRPATPYIDRWQFTNPGGRVAARPGPQPFIAQGVRMYGFVFEGKEAKLEALCARYLNHTEAAVTYHAVPPFWVFLTFTEAKRLACRNTPYSQMGSSEEQEAALWLMTAAVDRRSAVPEVRAAFFIPYIFVDNSLAVTQGREIYGFPKEMGQFAGFPAAGETVDDVTVSAFAVETFKKSSQADFLPALRLHRTGPGSSVAGGTWATFDEAARAITALLPELPTRIAADIEVPAKLLTQFLPPQRMVFLKQFHDAADGRQAAYQAIVETEASVTAFRSGAHLPGAYRLTLPVLDSHPIAADLGLKDGQQALLSYTLDFDFALQAGDVIWQGGV